MNFLKKTVGLFLIIIFLLSPILSRRAQAQWVVWDPGNFVPNAATAVNTGISAGNDVAQTTKEYGLDAVGWTIVNLIIERMAASTVTWINSGFQGSPAYVTDPEAYFTDIGDRVAGQFIFRAPYLNTLCGPINARIRIALTNNYIRDDDRRWRCTLSDVVDNVDDFMNDFERGGWDGFFELTQRQQNNPMGAYIQAENEMYAQIATRKGVKRAELDWGRGFMSFEVCGPEGRDSDGVCIGRAEIATPGSVIETKLNEVLNVGNNKLAAADEINEIVSALLNQLISRVVGGIGSGLRGLSGSGGTSNTQPFTNQLSNSTAAGMVDYFGNTTDTSILDLPPPNINQDLDSGRPTCNPQTDVNCVWNP